MFSLIVVILSVTCGYGLIMPMTNPDGSLDMSSLLSHIALLEQTMESKASVAETADLKTQLKTALAELATAQGELKTTREELSEVKSDLTSTHTELATLQAKLSDVSTLKTDIFRLQSLHNSSGGGATFTRWGKTTCPPGNTMIYRGYTGGTRYDAKASSATILCLPEHPLYAEHTGGHPFNAYIYGTEYNIFADNVLAKYENEDMPCVVCKSDARRSTIMLPARNQCYPGWNLEYWGYLMGAADIYASAEFICVDKDADTIPGGSAAVTGQQLFLAEGKCGSLPCPPYVNDWEITCSVCTQ